MQPGLKYFANLISCIPTFIADTSVSDCSDPRIIEAAWDEPLKIDCKESERGEDVVQSGKNGDKSIVSLCYVTRHLWKRTQRGKLGMGVISKHELLRCVMRWWKDGARRFKWEVMYTWILAPALDIDARGHFSHGLLNPNFSFFWLSSQR